VPEVKPPTACCSHFSDGSASAGSAHLAAAPEVRGTASLCGFTVSSALAPSGELDVAGGVADLVLTGRSATQVVLPGATDRVFVGGFVSGDTSEWSATAGGEG
jgi:hypothetical protein